MQILYPLPDLIDMHILREEDVLHMDDLDSPTPASTEVTAPAVDPVKPKQVADDVRIEKLLGGGFVVKIHDEDYKVMVYQYCANVDDVCSCISKNL